MTFEAWLESKGVSRKTFELRGTIVQEEMIKEFNQLNQDLSKLRL